MAWCTNEPIAGRAIRMFSIVAVGVAITAHPAAAIPLEIRNASHASAPVAAKDIPPRFDESPEVSVENTFIRKTLEEDTARIWLGTYRSIATSTNGGSLFTSDETTDDQSLQTHFVRLHNLDMETMDTGLGPERTPITSPRLYLPMENDLFVQDLRTRPSTTNEMAAVMKQVVKTLADQDSSSGRTSLQGWGSAVMCLLLAAMVFLVAVAKK